jgi:glycosyltransferase involved in cell wall biosynthesis
LARKIRLFVDAHSFDKEYQGVRTFLKEIYSILLGYEDLEIFFGVSNPQAILLDFPGLLPNQMIVYRKFSNSGRFLFEIPAILKEMKIDIAHFQYLVPFGKKRCVYLVTTHDILFNDFKSEFSFQYRFLRNILFRKGIRDADIKTTVSEYSRKRIEHYYRIPSNKIHVIANGVNKEFGNQFVSNTEALDEIEKKYGLRDYILYVSRIEPRKNHLALVRAYIETGMPNKKISLVFIGKHSLAVKELAEYIDALPANERSMIHKLDQVSQHDLEMFYKGARLFVYPSKAEGFGIPPLEAAISKVPVLCSNKTAMEDFYFFDPFRFDPYDQSQLNEKLAAMINQEPNSAHLDMIANKVLTTYSWNRSAESLYKLIRNIPI